MLTSTPRILLAPTTGIIVAVGSFVLLLLLLSGRRGEDTGVDLPLLPPLVLPADGEESRDIDIGDVA